MKISVICCVVNQLKYLEMLLWNMFNYQNFDHNDFEVIIVDDGAIEDILGFLKRDYAGKNVRYLRTNRKSRAGFPNAIACRSLPANLGVSFAKGEVLIFCDPDCYMLEPNHFSFFYEKLEHEKQLVSAILTKADTPEYFDYICGHYKTPEEIIEYIRIIDPGNQQHGMKPEPGLMAHNGKPEFVEIDGMAHQAYRHCRYWAVKREDFIDMGGFDEKSWWITCDVMEMHYRFDAAGFSYVPSPLHILHIYHEQYKWGCKVYPESFTLVKTLQKDVCEMIKNKTLPVYLPWNPKFYDDDVYIDLSQIKSKMVEI